METRRRSIVKALSWQMLGLLTMSTLGFLFTGSLTSGGALALASACVSFFAYLLHERLWAGVRWGWRIGGAEAKRNKGPSDTQVAA